MLCENFLHALLVPEPSLRGDDLLAGTYSEGCKSIRAYFEAAPIDPLEEIPKQTFTCLLGGQLDFA